MEACYKRAPSICLLCCTRRRCARAQGHQGLLAHSSPISPPHLSRNPSHLKSCGYLQVIPPYLFHLFLVDATEKWGPKCGPHMMVFWPRKEQYPQPILLQCAFYLLTASTRATHFIIGICLFDWIWLSPWPDYMFVIAWQRQLFWSSSVCFETFGKEIISCLKLQWAWTGWSTKRREQLTQ